MPNLLDLEELSVGFTAGGHTRVLVEGVSLSLKAGRVLGVVGESGAGKTVTMQAVLGLLRPPLRVLSGRAVFDGSDLTAKSRREMRPLLGRRIGFVPQNPIAALNPVHRISRQMLSVVRAHEHVSKSEARRRSLQAIRSVGLPAAERVLHAYPHQLSGGMAQRVVIAMSCLLHAPELIIADEPSTALDLTVQRQVLDLLTDLVVGTNRSMIIVTHDLGVVAQYCHDVAVLAGGQVVEQGPVLQVFDSPADAYTRSLIR